MVDVKFPDRGQGLILLADGGKFITLLSEYESAMVCIVSSDNIKDEIIALNKLIGNRYPDMPKIPTHIGIYKIREDIEYGWIDWEPITKELLILYDANISLR